MATPELIIAALGMLENIREIVANANPYKDPKGTEERLTLIRMNLNVADRYLKECLDGEEDEEPEEIPGL